MKLHIVFEMISNLVPRSYILMSLEDRNVSKIVQNVETWNLPEGATLERNWGECFAPLEHQSISLNNAEKHETIDSDWFQSDFMIKTKNQKFSKKWVKIFRTFNFGADTQSICADIVR